MINRDELLDREIERQCWKKHEGSTSIGRSLAFLLGFALYLSIVFILLNVNRDLLRILLPSPSPDTFLQDMIMFVLPFLACFAPSFYIIYRIDSWQKREYVKDVMQMRAENGLAPLPEK